MKKFFTYTYIITFSILIAAIGFLTLYNVDHIDVKRFKQSERRNPAPFPDWSLQPDSVDHFFSGLDAHINDNFAFRNEMVRAYSAILYSVRASANPGKIVLGRDDYLFIGNSYNQIIDHTKGKKLFSENDLKHWLNKFRYRKKYLDLFDIPFYIAVVPSKHVLYPEKLPGYIVPADYRNIHQILGSNHDLNLIYLKDTLDNAKEAWGKLLYNKTDSHWSEVGAYIGYLKIINWLKNDFRELETIQLGMDDFKVLPHPGWQNKHLLSLPVALDDFKVLVNWNNANWDHTLIKTNYAGETISYGYNKGITYKEKAIVYNDGKPYTLLVLQDSFIGRLSPYLNQSFGKIIYCHYSEPEALELTRLVEQHKPDLVLYELGEQSLFLHRDAHSNVISEILKNNLQVVKTRDGEQLYNEIISYNQIKETSHSNGNLYMTSFGNDPYFHLPAFDFSPDNHIQVDIEITSPGATSLQIFYLLDSDYGYSEKNSVTKQVQKGRNKISFHLPVQNIASKPIRFDPGKLPGNYIIHSITYLQPDI